MRETGFGIPGNPFTDSRLKGGTYEILRFLGAIRPLRLINHALLKDLWEGRPVGKILNSSVATIVAVQSIGEHPITSLQTSTRTYIADGYLCHNTHWDPGQLDVPYIVSKMGVPTPPTPIYEFPEEDMKTAVKDVTIGKDGKGWVAFETGSHVVACFGSLNSSNPKQRYPNFQGITLSSTTDGNQAIITVENATPNTKFGVRGFWING